MANEVWKSFEENTLTHSAAHYLMTIKELLDEHGYARVTDIAKRLNITRGSCSISLRSLKKRELVLEDENKFLLLSEEGRRLAELVERNDELLETLFREVLGVEGDQAEVDACKVEHLLSVQTTTKLASFIECIQSDAPPVREFLKELRRHVKSCTHDTESCDICEEVCFCEEQE